MVERPSGTPTPTAIHPETQGTAAMSRRAYFCTSDVGSRRVESQAGFGLAYPDCRVDANDLLKSSDSIGSEVPQPRIVGSELDLQTLPGNHCWFPKIAHPVGEPDLEVEREGRSL